jgi:hypothetical protein
LDDFLGCIMQDHSCIEGELSNLILVHDARSVNRLTKGDEIRIDFLVCGTVGEHKNMVIR